MSILRTLLAGCVMAISAASGTAAQTPGDASRWTLRVTPSFGAESGGGLIGQTSAWFTWDRLALGVRKSSALNFAIFGPSYEIKEQSALIGIANRKGRRSSFYAVGVAQTSGDGGYDSHCILLFGPCSGAPPSCLRGGDPSNGCELTPHTGFAAAMEFGLHFRFVGIGAAVTFAQTSQARIMGVTMGLQIGNMPAGRH